MTVKLRISGRHYGRLRSHLFPSDGKEAVAVALCGRRHGHESHCLCVHDLVLIPHEACSERSTIRVTWPTSLLVPSLQQAMKRQWAVVKIHSHRGHYPQFSGYDDDDSDLRFRASFDLEG
jgi:Prokaryotic homologs of the JAB domain